MCREAERCHRFRGTCRLDNQSKPTLKKDTGSFSETTEPLYKLIAAHIAKQSSLYVHCR